MTAELLPFAPDMPADAARAALERAGWSLIGTGHWAWVYAHPSEPVVARVTPVDPAYRIFVDDCLRGPANRFLPEIAEVVPLVRDGYVVVMERLWPVDDALAGSFCAQLGVKHDSGFDPPVASDAFDGANDPDFAALRERVRGMMAAGAARYRLWGGADIKESCVMRNTSGQLKLVDPVFLAGRRICEALLAGRTEELADFSRAWLEDFLTIPVFEPDGDAGGGHAELVAALKKLYG
jgi:hypothetical protein